MLRSILTLMVITILLGACAAPQAAPAETRPPSAAAAENLPTYTSAPTQAVTSTATSRPTAKPTATKRPLETPRTPTATTGIPFQLSDLSSLGMIAFTAEDNWVYVMNADGSNLRRLKGANGRHFQYGEKILSWSPDGRFVSAALDGAIYVLSADGQTENKLTEGTIFHSAWSPDGKWIAFTSDQAGVKHPSGQAYYIDLFIIRPDGTDIQKLTKSDHYCHFPSWSPFSNYLVIDCLAEGDLNIYKASIQGGTEKMTSLTRATRANWSSDGKKISFCDDYDELYVMDENGRNQTTVAKIGCDLSSISPDGKSIVFQVYEDRDFELYVVDIKGENLCRLTNNDVDDIEPGWSPDSRYIVYQSGETIAVVKVDTGEVLTLTAGSQPVWTKGKTSLVKQLPDCSNGWTRLKAGDFAKVSNESTTPNRVRSEPKKGENTVGQIHPRTVVKVLEGPVCTEGLVFWLVESEVIPGGIGWTAEGDGMEYYLIPEK